MKKLLILFFGAVALVSSCRKDLNEEPFNAISDKDAFASADRIDKSAVGMYNALQNANYFSGRILIYADIRGIDASPATYFGNLALFNLLQANDGTVAGAWQGAYRTIYEANLFLKSFLPNAALVSATKADQYVGEAKYIRALCYFYLVNMWAQPYSFTADGSHLGVPLVLTASDDPFDASNNLPRATVKQVYDAMEADLLDAEAKLPATYSDAYTRVSRATKGAARALLARLYLYKKDYNKASSFANAVITSTTPAYALNPSPITAFRNYTTSESIFSVAFDGGDNPNTNNSIGQHYGPTRRADIPISTDFVLLYGPTDLRKIATGTDSLIQFTSGTYWTRKYNAGTTDWVPVSRLSEMILTRAEALANLAAGTTADPVAITLLNQVRGRSNATPAAPATKAALLDAIYLERRLELAFEGQGSLDFLRTNRAIPAHSIVAAQPFGSNYTILPIPKYDLDKNPNLQPNPGY